MKFDKIMEELSRGVETVGGVAMWKREGSDVKVLVVHPGGPLFWNEPDQHWGVPKGHVEKNENIEKSAIREFEEETGMTLPRTPLKFIGEFDLFKTKKMFLYAVEGDGQFVKSNMFEMEWPKGSGQMRSFPENDDGRWMSFDELKPRLAKSQVKAFSELEKFISREISAS